jgi:hypothetical protein
MGHPVQIHFGVNKDENGFRGHSWVTMAETFAEQLRLGYLKQYIHTLQPGSFSLSTALQNRDYRNRTST